MSITAIVALVPRAGLIDGLARPGGDMTGLTFLAFELVGKRLELYNSFIRSRTLARRSNGERRLCSRTSLSRPKTER